MAENKNQFDIDPNTKILVTCGNSKLGGNVIKYLLARNFPAKNIITTVRSPQKGEKWKEKGIEIRIADYKDPESLEKAFQNVDRLYMVSSVGEPNYPRDKQHLNVVEAAKKCKVKLIVYSSFINCQNNTNWVANDHKYTEKIIEESGLNYSHARNATYTDCEGPLFKYLMKKENNIIYNSCGDKKIAYVLIRELGEAGAGILLRKENKKIYELSGEPVSYYDIKKAMEKITGKEIKIVDIPTEEIGKKYEELGLGKFYAMKCRFMNEDYSKGIYDVQSDDLQNLMGHPVTPLEEAIKEVINAPDYFPM